VRIEALVMGEGLAQDADGLFTMVRIGQNIFAPAALPAQTKRSFLLLLVEDEAGENLEGETLEVSYQFLDPGGVVTLAQSVSLQVGEKRFKDLRAASWIPCDVMLSVSSRGTHSFEAVLRRGLDELDRKSTNLHVLDANALAN
jgi:hypothetical protein